ncbi:hypothetical protein HDU93_002618 [Gonapodya sp. JEL0774]|nr:hypothetical protein HDU93_002618 [Gonapodya sp. JEL0774]
MTSPSTGHQSPHTAAPLVDPSRPVSHGGQSPPSYQDSLYPPNPTTTTTALPPLRPLSPSPSPHTVIAPFAFQSSIVAEEFNLAKTHSTSFAFDKTLHRLVPTNSRSWSSPSFVFSVGAIHDPTPVTTTDSSIHSRPVLTSLLLLLKLAHISQFFREAFLPDGFPHSVTPDYLPYQICDSVQAFASAITGLLATRAVLKGSGVGDTSATATGALVTWVVKDGTGMLGKILFAWKVNTRLDSDAKTWRFVADILNDTAILIDLLSSHLPRHLFPLLVALSTLLRAVCGVAAGASKSAITVHFARLGNAGDLNAKEGSQETVVGLAGMVAGTFLLTSLPDTFPTTMSLFLLLTSFHLSINYLGVSRVVLATLNRQRSAILVAEWCRAAGGGAGGGDDAPQVLGRTEVAEREGVFWWMGGPGVSIGCRIRDVLAPTHPPTHLSALLAAFSPSPHILTYHGSTVRVALSSSAQPVDVFRAWYHAVVTRCAVRGDWEWRGWEARVGGWAGKGAGGGGGAGAAGRGLDGPPHLITDPHWDLTMSTLAFTRATFDVFLTQLRVKGWDVDRMVERSMLEEGVWRYRAGGGGGAGVAGEGYKAE